MSTEGLRTSGRPLGVLGSRWLARLERVDKQIRDRVLRGRTLARGGRVREIGVAPGSAFATVDDASEHSPSLKVRDWEDAEWARAVGVLTSRLSWLADLLEGAWPAELLDALTAQRVSPLPSPGEIQGDCDCGDWALPCAHGAALEHVLAEVLDADPFVLFALRGRNREQLWAEIRKAWGDAGGDSGRTSVTDEPPVPADGWTELTTPLPKMLFRFGARPEHPGTTELGPLEGDDGLDRVLQPLYGAGAAYAVELALAEPSGTGARRRRTSAPPPPPTPEEDSSERLVDALAEAEEGATAAELGKAIGWTEARARTELVALEALGLVARTGRGKRERWWLG